jgi:peptide/nickel transport system ATP-binding protein
VAIARALAVQPRFLVCDEAVSALDVSVQAQVLNLLLELRRDRHLTFLFIAHNLAVVQHMATHVAVMRNGRIVETGTTETVFNAPQHPWTQTLLSSMPKPLRARR